MQNLTVHWYRNSAARFIELLKVYDWNGSVRILKAEIEAAKRKIA
jgi:hypothetical protein